MASSMMKYATANWTMWRSALIACSKILGRKP